MKYFALISIIYDLASGQTVCLPEAVIGFGCTQSSAYENSFECQQIIDASNSTAYPTIVADEYNCIRCRTSGTDASANPLRILNCVLSRTCEYSSVVGDKCLLDSASDSLTCSKTDVWFFNNTNTPYIMCSGDVCNSTAVASPLVENCRKCYSSNLIGVNCAVESDNSFFSCNQYYTFDAVQTVSSQAGTNYAFTSGVIDVIYECSVLLCVDSTGNPLYDLDTVTSCTPSNPPLGQGYQY